MKAGSRNEKITAVPWIRILRHAGAQSRRKIFLTPDGSEP